VERRAPSLDDIAPGAQTLRYDDGMKSAKKTAKKTAKTASKKKTAPKQVKATSGGDAKYIEQRITALGGWRATALARLRSLILEAEPDFVEERKWIKPSNPHGVPTYSHGGIVLTLEVYQDHVKVTFAQGSKVKDPKGIFNASLVGVRRAVDMREGDVVDAAGFKALVKAAVALNAAKKR
jgi:hypothetical protein